jgi:2'-5' RNA ligase
MSVYLAFAWDIDPDKLHVTHKYLGDISAEDERQMIAFVRHTLRHFIKIKGPVRINFDKVAEFGKEKRVRVLVPSDKERAKAVLEPFEVIRRELSVLREDDFEYRPHVTTSESSAVAEPFTRYVVMRGSEIIFEHRLEANG